MVLSLWASMVWGFAAGGRVTQAKTIADCLRPRDRDSDPVYRIGYDIAGRYIGALTKGQVSDKYAEGLERLKRLAETGAASR